MKYLKKFESSSPYYNRIDGRSYLIKLRDNSIKPLISTKKEQLYLSRLIDNSFELIFDSNKHMCTFLSIEREEISNGETTRTAYYINKVEDEWFYVIKFVDIYRTTDKWILKVEDITYECDQLEGLIKYLKDEKVIL